MGTHARRLRHPWSRGRSLSNAAVEVLSPEDRFTRVIQKCRKYAEWGVQDILVFDPVGREACYWDAIAGDLIRIKERFRFRSLPVELVQDDVWRRFEDELR